MLGLLPQDQPRTNNVGKNIFLKIVYEMFFFIFINVVIYSESKIMTWQLGTIEALCIFVDNIVSATVGLFLIYQPVNTRISFGQMSFFYKVPLPSNNIKIVYLTIGLFHL